MSSELRMLEIEIEKELSSVEGEIKCIYSEENSLLKFFIIIIIIIIIIKN